MKKRKICTIAIITLMALAAVLCMKVVTNANRMRLVKTWLGLDALPSAEKGCKIITGQSQ